MELFKNLFNTNNKNETNTIGGYISKYNLTDWWLLTFNKEEREYIVNKYGSDLIEGQPYFNTEVYCFLGNLSSWFSTKKDLSISLRILEKAESLFNYNSSITDEHFYYMNNIEIYYKDRENNTSFEKTIEYCNKQISISNKVKTSFLKEDNDTLQSHVGFKQLAIIEEKRGNLQKALELSKQAQIEGWNGDWDDRIAKLEKKLKK